MSSKGIKINFKETNAPASLDFSKTVEGFKSVVQNGMVNLGTREGTDALNPDKGTGLFSAAVVGSLIDRGERDHETALAAEQTRLFLRAQEEENNFITPISPERISRVGLEVSDIDLKMIVFNAYFVNVDEEVVGEPLVNVLQ